MNTFQCGCCQEACDELFPIVNPNFGVPTGVDLVCGSCAVSLQSEYFVELFCHPMAYLPVDDGRVIRPRSLVARRVA